MDRKDYPIAISALNKSSELDPNDARSIRAIYDIHIITKQYDEAKEDIDYLLWLELNN